MSKEQSDRAAEDWAEAWEKAQYCIAELKSENERMRKGLGLIHDNALTLFGLDNRLMPFIIAALEDGHGH